jgi:hypothetical protein
MSPQGGEAVKHLRLILLLLPLAVCTLLAFDSNSPPAPTTYRSKASGDWDAVATWEYLSLAAGWQAASSLPSPADSVLIQSGHSVTVTSNLSLVRTNIEGQLVVNSGYTLTVSSVGGNPGATVSSTGVLRIKGTLTVSGIIELSWGSTIVYNGSSAQTITSLDYKNLEVDNPAGVDLPVYVPPSSVFKAGSRSSAISSYITIYGSLTLTNGDLRTGSSQLNLGASASVSENAPYSVLGKLYTSRQCTTGTNNTFGGIGIEITVNSGWPIVGVTRITGSAPTDTNKTLIKRRFELSSGGSGLNATIEFHYATDDLNGVGESNLRLYESTNGGASWVSRGGSLNTGDHSITITGVNTLNNWSAGQPAGIPTLSSVSPSSAERGSTLNITLSGTQFVNGSTSVSFGSGITVNSTTVNSSTQITAGITVSAGTSTGFRDVTVTTPGGAATLTNGFEVQTAPNPTPTLFSASPSTGNRGQVLDVALQGTGFQSGLTSVTFGSGVTVTSVSVANSSTMTVQISVAADAVLGARTVSVTNPAPGGGTVAKSNIFSVTNPVPTLSAISPASGGRTETLDVTLTGTSFVRDSSNAGFGDGVTVLSTTFSSSTSVVARISIASTAVAGTRNVSVTNSGPGGGSTVLPAAFSVVNPLPTITSAVPDSGGTGQTVSVTINGTGFISGVTLLSFDSDITVSQVNVLSSTQLTGQLTIAASAANGPRTVAIVNSAPGGGTAMRSGGFRIINPVPTVTGIVPGSGVSGQNVTVTVSGSNFIAGQTTVNLGSGIATNSVTVNSRTQLAAAIAISPSAAGGSRTLTVTNIAPGGGSASLVDGFLVNNPVPTIASLTTSSGDRSKTLGLYANGTGFIDGVTSISFGAGITVNSASVSTPTQMYVSITVAPDAAFGTRDVIVTNAAPGGGTSKLTAYFKVMNPFPTLTSLSPNSGTAGQSLSVTLSGTGFVNGVSIAAFGDGIVVNSATSNTAGTQMVTAITISPTAAIGTRNVSVTNPAPGGGAMTLNGSFSILAPAPTISGISPSIVVRGQTTLVTIAGANFFTGTTSISLGAGIVVNSFAVNSLAQMTANITVGAEASTGTRDVVVTNAPPGGGSATLSGVLTVQNPFPVFSGISPAQAARGDALVVTLTGLNFIEGVTTVSFGDGIVVNSVSVTSSTQATASISIGNGAVLGSRNVSAINPPPGGGASTLANVFTVGNPVPTLTTSAPTAGKRGQTLNLTLTGSGFISGATTASFGGNIVVNSLVVNSATQLIANVFIGVDAVPGVRGISVTNPAPGGGTATLASGLAVENPLPALSGISPVSGVRGTTTNVTLTGVNFIAGLSQTNFGSDIQVNTVTISSATQIVVGITIAPAASTGPRDVLVIHAPPGGGTAMLPGGFSVTNPIPSVNSVTPVSAGRGSVLTVKVTGTQFMTGATSLSFGADISVSSLVVKSSTELQASITISSSAVVGSRSVTVTNAAPGGGPANLPNGFNVSTSPATEIQADPGALPKEYVLQEAYPNPFNPSTRISYSLPELSRIWLVVHNMLGNVVAELAVGERSKGLYELQWHADNLPSGVYLVRMHAESLESSKRFIASRKVVLVK